MSWISTDFQAGINKLYIIHVTWQRNAEVKHEKSKVIKMGHHAGPPYWVTSLTLYLDHQTKHVVNLQAQHRTITAAWGPVRGTVGASVARSLYSILLNFTSCQEKTTPPLAHHSFITLTTTLISSNAANYAWNLILDT